MAGKIDDRALRRAMGWARAPFGRIGEALGLRWIMPIGTIPLPFHPGLALLLPLVVPAVVLHRIVVAVQGQEGGVTWRSLFVAAALAAIPLAIPIVQWLALAFRLPLIQGLLIGGAMLLLAVDAATGAVPAWAALLPVAWAGLYIVQRIGGARYLRRLQAENEAFEPVPTANRLVLVEGDTVPSDYAGWLNRNADLGRVAREAAEGHSSRLRDSTFYRLAPADLERVAERIRALKPDGWHVGDRGVTAPGLDEAEDEGAVTPATPAGPPIRIRARRHRAPLWLVSGERSLVEVRDGARVQRLIGGAAAVVGPLPLFTIFYYFSIFGGRSGWVAGFARDRPVMLGPARVYDLLLKALPPLPDSGPSAFADPAPLLERLDALEAEVLGEARELLGRLLDPQGKIPVDWRVIARNPRIAFGRGAELCAALAAAKARKDERAVQMAATLIAALPDAEYRDLAGTLLALLNSKELAFRLVDDEAAIGLPEREKRAHIVGGFSLVKWVPELYERLGDLGEPARRLIFGLGETGRWPPALVRARERLERESGRGSGPRD